MRARPRPPAGYRAGATAIAIAEIDAVTNSPRATRAQDFGDLGRRLPVAWARPAIEDALRFRHLVRHLHRLGPRPVGELRMEIGREHGIEGGILERLENFGRFDPATVAQLNGRDWSRVPLGLVR